MKLAYTVHSVHPRVVSGTKVMDGVEYTVGRSVLTVELVSAGNEWGHNPHSPTFNLPFASREDMEAAAKAYAVGAKVQVELTVVGDPT